MRSSDFARRALVVGSALLGVVLAAPTLSEAQGNIQLGPFRLLPVLEVGVEYNDNVVLSPPGQEESDLIWIISPEITLELPGRRSALRVGYRANIKEYTDNSSLSFVEHIAQAEWRLNQLLGGRLNLYVTDRFLYTEDPTGFPVPELTERVPRADNLLRVGGEYSLAERWSLGVDYSFYWIDYGGAASNDVLDHVEHTIGVTGYYRIQPKTSLLAEYRYQIVRYDQENVAGPRDSDSNFLLGGVKGDFTAKTSAQVKVGYQWKDYKSEAETDFDGLVVEAEVIWKYAEPSQLRLFGGRANVESTFVVGGNNYYVANYGGLELRHQITPDLLLRVRGLFGTNDYPDVATVGTTTAKRQDDFAEAGIGLTYQMRRWLAFTLDYYFLWRDSNFNDFDYTNNRVAATVRLTY